MFMKTLSFSSLHYFYCYDKTSRLVSNDRIRKFKILHY